MNEYTPNLFENRVKALRNIAGSFLDAYKRQITAPETLPPGEVERKAKMLKSSLELVYKNLNEIID